jgi:hypothetical protein
MSGHSSEARDIVFDVTSPDVEVEVLLSPKQHQNNIKSGWVKPSELSLNTLETMETKVANELSDFRKADDDSQKTWSRMFVEKVLIKVSSDPGPTTDPMNRARSRNDSFCSRASIW